jgi:hypothetical protein
MLPANPSLLEVFFSSEANKEEKYRIVMLSL